MGLGSSKSSGHQGSRDFEQDELFGADPSVVGLPRPEGWRVRLPTGLGAWDKTGPADTDWTPVGGGGGGAITSVVGVDGILVTNGSGPVVTVGQRPIAATWTIDRMRVYAVDGANGDDAHAGFADPASSSSAAYTAASIAAGLVAKKTVAGLAAIFPRVGNGRLVEIQFAPGTYAGSPADFLNGTSGYVSGCPLVRGTGTVASAGTVAFDGTIADATVVGAATATALNAAGYTPAGSIGTSSIQCTKVGGAAPAFAVSPALPLGVRIRFASAAPTQAPLRNQCQQVARVAGTDTVRLQSALPAVPIATTDTFFAEQPAVVFGNASLQDLDPGSGATFVGVAFGTLGLRSGRAFFAFCTSAAFFTDSGDGAEFAQFYAHPVWGFLTVGGGLRVTGGATLGGGSWICQGLVSTTQTTFNQSASLFWGDGCAARNLVVLNARVSQNDDANQTPDLGVDEAQSDGIPFTFGSSSGGGVNLDGATLQIGNLDCSGAGANPALRIRGRCNLVFSGTVTGTSGNNDVGMDLQNSTLSAIELRNGRLPSVAGAAGQLRWCGQAIDVWSRFNFEEAYDVGANRIYLGDTNASYRHTIDPAVTLGVNNNGSDLPAFTIVRTNGTNLQAAAATASSITAAHGLYGVLVNAPGNGAACLVNGFSGIKLLIFDAAPTVGQLAFLSESPGLATVTPPAVRIKLGVVVGNSFPGNLAIVRISIDDPDFNADSLLSTTFRNRWLGLSPAAFSMFQFDDMDYRININTDDPDGSWQYANGATRTSDHPTCAKCVGAGLLANVAVNRQGEQTIANQRTTKWLLAGAMYFEDAVLPLDDWRALALTANANTWTVYVSVGLHAFISADHFSFSIHGGGIADVVSTVAFSTGWHRLELWHDGTSVFGSVDGETPILITSTATDIPDGILFQWHGAISGLGTAYVDAVSTGGERP